MVLYQRASEWLHMDRHLIETAFCRLSGKWCVCGSISVEGKKSQSLYQIAF